jgi:hypothetical protein
MRQKKLIAPEPTSLDRAEYKFKPSFPRLLSLNTAVVLLVVFIAEVISPTISTTTVFALPISIVYCLIISSSLSYILMKCMHLNVSPSKVSGLDDLSRRIQIEWQDIILIKSCSIGARSISIRSAIDRRKIIHLGVWFYDVPGILDRVREYAGEDNPLTIALGKEVSLPREKPVKWLWRIISGITLILSIWLIGGNLYAEYREQPLNQAIASYVRQHPKTAPNQSAIDLQTSIAKLGFSVGKFGDGSKVNCTY